ncbi:MAG: YceD family protein [Actinomycetota bacterium]|nr:YceD family protein [Actinomycetota bacterium]
MPNTRKHAPRSALVFDTRSLSRQAGSALTQSRTVPAPDDLRLELVYVPVGADVEIDVRFEAVTEGVLATGSGTAPLAGECARCLAPLNTTLTAGFQELYLYDDGPPRGSRGNQDKRRPHDPHDRREKSDRYDQDTELDDEERHLDGDLLDLEPAFRDAVVLALPISPLCRDDCPGLCAECGAPLAEAGPDHGHQDAIDPRWAGLKQLNGQQDQAGNQPDRRARAIDLQEG